MGKTRKSAAASLAFFALAALVGGTGLGEAAGDPVYIHMNGANEFLEDVVAVRPGEKVVFVNEDTDPHAVVGYNPETGATSKRFHAIVPGTKGPGHKVSTYSIAFRHSGIDYYYCSIHAVLKREPGGRFRPKVRPGVGGFGAPMAGIIIVTTDPKLLAANPRSASRKILRDYFGG